MRQSSGGDAEDWAAASAGDELAFNRVFDRHHDRVRRHASRLVLRPADTDDVVAVAFFEAWRRRADVRFVDASILPWLLVVTTNVARNHVRSALRYRKMLATLPPPDPVTVEVTELDGPSMTAMRALPVNDRQVLALCVLEGYSETEAATALGIPRGTVKSRLSRAKQRLATRLREQPRTALLRKECADDHA
jgi:RNA polymerase sigma factor (sigma-70 family)